MLDLPEERIIFCHIELSFSKVVVLPRRKRSKVFMCCCQIFVETVDIVDTVEGVIVKESRYL